MENGDVGIGIESGPPDPVVWRRWLAMAGWAVLIITMAVTVLLVIGTIVTNYRGEAASERILVKLKRRGLPTDASFLIKDSRSFSAQPETDEQEGEHGTRIYLAAFELATNAMLEGRALHLGFEVNPELCRPIDKELAGKLQALVHNESALFSLLERARQYSMPSYDLSPRVDDSEGRRFARGSISAANVLALKSLHEQASGQAEKALDACEAILDLNSVMRQPSYGTLWLTRECNGASFLFALEQLLSRCTPDRASLQKVRAKLLAEAAATDLRELIRTEIAICADQLQHLELYVSLNLYQQEKALTLGVFAGFAEMGVEFRGQKLPSEKRIRRSVAISRLWSTVCPGSRKPVIARGIDRMLKWYEKLDGATGEEAAFLSPIAADLQKEWTLERGQAEVLLEILVHRARMRAAAAAISMELYRLEHDRWPEKLSELEGGTPKDVLDGNDLKYVRTDSGCMLYSIGRNLADDGGEQDYQTGADDIAFRLFDTDKRNVP